MSDRKPSLGFRLSPWHLTLDDLEQSWFKIIKITRQISHTGMVVPECYKDDVESQWKSLKYDPDHPKTPEPMATKIGTGDYVPDIHPRAKLHYDPIRRFCPPPAYAKLLTKVFWVLPTRYRLGLCADFDDQYVKRRPFAQGCAFWGFREQICICWLHFRQKTQILVVSRRDLENFGPNRALTWRFRQ